MHKLIYFLKKIYVPLIFVVAEIAAIFVYAGSTPYSQAKLVGLSHYTFGWVEALFTEVNGYFSLRRDNIILNERIAQLENMVNAYKSQVDDSVEISVDLQSHQYIACRVVSNSINKSKNYIVVNKGLSDGVRVGMSLLSPEGYAVGCVTNCSQNYAIATSILNTALRVSARLSKDGSMGLAGWQGDDSRTIMFSDVTKYANIEKGDIVEAIDFSEYFPSGTVIGTIESATLNDEQTMYNCTLHLSADMSRLSNVILVDSRDIDQVRLLKKEPELQYNQTPEQIVEQEQSEE